MDINPNNDLHTCKMEYEDDSASEILLLVKYFNERTYILNRLQHKIVSRNDRNPSMQWFV